MVYETLNFSEVYAKLYDNFMKVELNKLVHMRTTITQNLGNCALT